MPIHPSDHDDLRGPFPSTSEATPNPRRRHRGWWITAAVLGLCLGGACAFGVVALVNNPALDERRTAAPPLRPEITEASQAAATTAVDQFGDGLRGVGDGPDQIRPGTYTVTVPGTSVLCYWARLSGTTGTAAEIITNGTASPSTPTKVTIAAADKAFDSRGCGVWKLER